MIAVIPAAGLATRLLPASKTIPKALWPIDAKPALHWVLEEALAAGLTKLVIVLSPTTQLVRHYLTPLPEGDPRQNEECVIALDKLLEQFGIRYIFQGRPLGLGDALLRVKTAIGEPAFALMLPDNVWTDGAGPIGRLLAVHQTSKMACLAIHDRFVPGESDGAFTGSPLGNGVVRIQPAGFAGDESESRVYAGIGRAIVATAALDHLRRAVPSQRGDSDETALWDGLAASGELLGVLVEPPRYHLGSATGPKPPATALAAQCAETLRS